MTVSEGQFEAPAVGEEAVGEGTYWEAVAQAYYQEHGSFLGDRKLRWCPEGWQEETVHLLGDIRGLDVIEIGCGAGQGSRWAQTQGARAVGIDSSRAMLTQAAKLNAQYGDGPALIQADARRLPFQDASFDLAFSAFGALPFVPSLAEVHSEVYRTLRPGGRWVYATSHPFAWVFPDSPLPEHLVVARSYFSPAAYTERDANGHLNYAEYPHTFSEHINSLVNTGFSIQAIFEPTWGRDAADWGSWSAERCALVPGTVIISSAKTI
jgi:SAM-dependent methyltransferase